MTLLICPVRPGDSNEELRYALRSWEENLCVPDRRLITVGYKPSWLKPDDHVEGNFYSSAPLAVWDNVRLGAEAAVRIFAEEPIIAKNSANGSVLMMNDDFFCMDPVGSILPVRRNCSLADQIRSFPQGANLWWPKSLRLTASWLAEQGFPDPHSYEVHRPLICKPGDLLSAMGKWEGGMEGAVPQWRTVYGVLNQIEAYPVKDAKLGLRVTGVGSPWLSTSDETWRRFAPAMSKRFQKPSRWEA